MRAIFSQSLIFSCLLSLLVLSPSTSAFASPSWSKATGGCSHLHVHLNGQEPATQTCLDDSGLDCRNGENNIELILWWDANYSGPSICFSGTGSVDLTTFSAPPISCSCDTWDNQVSSFEIIDRPTVVTIYADPEEHGQSISYRDRAYQDNFSDTPIEDNNASSISIQLASTN